MARDPRAVSGVYVGLGANLGDPFAQLRAALDALDRGPATRVLRASNAFRTPPWGPVVQPAFVNAVAEVETTLDAESLLAYLLSIEAAAGRTRGAERWGPRVIDLDLLLYGAQQHDRAGCRVPHPRMAQRAFVLVPLAQLAARVAIPGAGSVAQALAALPAAERGAVVDLGPLADAHPRMHPETARTA
jgi:2-amino-4-hydroxy-6-hydroxymethyldihydropteridine diphosphokinase